MLLSIKLLPPENMESIHLHEKAVQTDIDSILVQHAHRIVVNFEKIEARWNIIEKKSIKTAYTNKLLLSIIGINLVYKLVCFFNQKI